ncbi:MAG: hypothetical protein R3236_06200 [Phycisphaeraceae bacterium]|nr:hypothetical protein [Phycisphaeraceae bacterium]
MIDADKIRDQIMGKGPNEVRAALGDPEAVSNWDTEAPPKDATPEQLDEFKRTTLGDIWAYRGAVVSFNLVDKVADVDDDWEEYVDDDPMPMV